VLARARFGDDPLFAHAPGQQALAQGIVDFVRAQVVQILALKPDLRALAFAAQVGAVEHGAGAARKVFVKAVQLPLEFRIGLGGLHGAVQFVQARLDRLRHILAAVRAEKAFAVRLEAGGGLLAHACSLLRSGFRATGRIPLPSRAVWRGACGGRRPRLLCRALQ
jgi:hypothetical protein